MCVLFKDDTHTIFSENAGYLQRNTYIDDISTNLYFMFCVFSKIHFICFFQNCFKSNFHYNNKAITSKLPTYNLFFLFVHNFVHYLSVQPGFWTYCQFLGWHKASTQWDFIVIFQPFFLNELNTKYLSLSKAIQNLQTSFNGHYGKMTTICTFYFFTLLNHLDTTPFYSRLLKLIR